MNYHISADRTKLTLIADAEDRAILRQWTAEGDGIGSDRLMYDFLEPITCNSELQWVNPSETGDLTDAPMLGIYGEEGIKDLTVFAPNHGLVETGSDGRNTYVKPILERWGYMSYAVRSLLEDLRDTGEVILVSSN